MQSALLERQQGQRRIGSCLTGAWDFHKSITKIALARSGRRNDRGPAAAESGTWYGSTERCDRHPIIDAKNGGSLPQRSQRKGRCGRCGGAAEWAQKKSPQIDGELFDFRTLQVIRLRHVSKSLTCRYPSSLLWEDSHESLSQWERRGAEPLPGCCR